MNGFRFPWTIALLNLNLLIYFFWDFVNFSFSLTSMLSLTYIVYWNLLYNKVEDENLTICESISKKIFIDVMRYGKKNN